MGCVRNLSPDHIGPGEHKTFEEYRSWKGQLFKRCDVGVVNIDDENTAALLEGHTCKLVTYGRDEKADYRETGYELLRTHDFSGRCLPRYRQGRDGRQSEYARQFSINTTRWQRWPWARCWVCRMPPFTMVWASAW